LLASITEMAVWLDLAGGVVVESRGDLAAELSAADPATAAT
jgi:hypothetical protein